MRRIHVWLWGAFVLFRGYLFDLGANVGARGPLFSRFYAHQIIVRRF
jgi:hypothetical protein